MSRLLPSQVLRFTASIPVIVLLTARSPALAQQKPAQPTPHSQTQLEEHVKELEKRLDAADQKAASAAKELEARLNAAEQKAADAPEEENVVPHTPGLSFISVCVFLLPLPKEHFAPISSLPLSRQLTHLLYPRRPRDPP